MAELVAHVVRDRPVLAPAISRPRGRRRRLSSGLTALACFAVLMAAGLLVPPRLGHAPRHHAAASAQVRSHSH